MKKTLAMPGLILLFLALLDLGVAVLLHQAEARGRLGSLVRYFDYGRSVPGKLAQWQAHPGTPGNLYDVAWRPDILAASAAGFAAEPSDMGPVIRSYGMSFVGNIIAAAQAQDPGLRWDNHAGPGAPPNFTYALFQEDRGNRRPGDIVVLGILSSAIPGMAALGNRSWVFEQPAPFTYPVFHPEGAGLVRTEPLVISAADQRALAGDAAAARAWADQLAATDAFHAPVTFGAVWLDASPFARLVRRALAKSHIARTEAAILDGGVYPHAEVLGRMITEFARTARADGQVPVVMLIQTRNPADADVLALAAPALRRDGVAYLATAEIFDPADPSGFVSDGHYTPAVDAAFGQAFLRLLPGADQR